MKLGRIFLNSLLEARVSAITDTFFTRFKEYINRSTSIRQEIAAIKKYIREKEAKATYTVKDKIKVNPKLWDIEAPPKKQIEDIQETIASQFLDNVFIRLSMDPPSNIEFIPTDISYKKTENNIIETIQGIVYIDNDKKNIRGYVGIEINLPRSGAPSARVSGNSTLIKYEPTKGKVLVLWAPKTVVGDKEVYAQGQYMPGVNTVSRGRGVVNPERAKTEREKVFRDYKNDKDKLPVGLKGITGAGRKYFPVETPKELRASMSSKDLFKSGKSASKPYVNRVKDFMEGRGEFEDVKRSETPEAIIKTFEKPVIGEKPNDLNLMKDRITTIVDTIKNDVVLKYKLATEDDVELDSLIRKEGDPKDGKQYMSAKLGPIEMRILIDTSNYRVYLKSPDPNRLTQLKIQGVDFF